MPNDEVGDSLTSGSLLTEAQVASALGLSKATLRKWRCQRHGPAFLRLSRRCIRYRSSDVQAFVSEHVASRSAVIA